MAVTATEDNLEKLTREAEPLLPEWQREWKAINPDRQIPAADYVRRCWGLGRRIAQRLGVGNGTDLSNHLLDWLAEGLGGGRSSVRNLICVGAAFPDAPLQQFYTWHCHHAPRLLRMDMDLRQEELARLAAKEHWQKIPRSARATRALSPEESDAARRSEQSERARQQAEIAYAALMPDQKLFFLRDSVCGLRPEQLAFLTAEECLDAICNTAADLRKNLPPINPPHGPPAESTNDGRHSHRQ